jgi:hypothetical protein
VVQLLGQLRVFREVLDGSPLMRDPVRTSSWQSDALAFKRVMRLSPGYVDTRWDGTLGALGD